MADDAGALLVRSGLVSSSALDAARARVDEAGGTLGEQLVASGEVGDDALTEFYKTRLLVPQVNPNTLARLPAKVVATLPGDLAIELRAIPVALDAENNLTVAMSDPSDSHAVDEIAFFTGTYVVRAVATQMQIAWCLAHYYGHVTPLGHRLLQPGAGPATERTIKAAVRPTPRPRGLTDKIAAARHAAIAQGTAAAADTPRSPASPPSTQAGVPQLGPRAHSVSGEIRIAKPRATTVKPPLPEDESGPVISIEVDPEASAPVITIEAEDTEELEPPRPRRLRPAKADPPELAARAGEIDMKTGKIHVIGDGPRVVIAEELVASPAAAGQPAPTEAPSISVEIGDEASAPVVIHEHRARRDGAPTQEMDTAPSQPILLERRRPGDSLPPDGDDDDDVVVLEPKAAPRRRPERRTQMGIGALPAVTRPKRDTETSAVPADIDDLPTGSRARIDDDPTRVDARAAPAGDLTPTDDTLAAPPSPLADDDTSPVAAPPASRAVPPPSGKVSLDNVRRAPLQADDDDDEHGVPTEVMAALEVPDVEPGPRVHHVDDDDDGWGPPGTTIPPPLLGAIPGALEPVSGIIPIPSVDSAPLMIAPPAAPEVVRATTSGDAGIARALEEAMARVLDLIRTLEHAADRDEVVAAMIAHLAETHRRAGFFAVRGGELVLFAMHPRPPVLPWAALRLDRPDRPSTFDDVVGTRLPYRGPMHDDASSTFLTAVLGACPPEILLVPVALRERVVGVLFGDHRMRHTFDDQLALAARAAGLALERILKARRG